MLTLRVMNEAQLRQIYNLGMRRDFPEAELKPLNMLVRLQQEGVYDALGAYDGERLAAYAMVYRRKSGRIVLLDYLAVEPDRRGSGVGGEWLSLLREYYAKTADALFIECELPEATPDAELARSRIHFYERAGARVTNLCVFLFGVDFRILLLPCAGREKKLAIDCERELVALYKEMLTPEGYKTWARLYHIQA